MNEVSETVEVEGSSVAPSSIMPYFIALSTATLITVHGEWGTRQGSRGNKEKARSKEQDEGARTKKHGARSKKHKDTKQVTSGVRSMVKVAERHKISYLRTLTDMVLEQGTERQKASYLSKQHGAKSRKIQNKQSQV
ncbi:hypothetical protein KSP40_PGU016212 [Platanthera guangdongensis]|uniref:Uncharacterized protein n=1 Tax=Platanthera guangdongensis TaxID=2320717 RepID=A0ABR2M765_9ASPA